ncbi:ABC transporter substrate-binding protein [Lacisediminihabitans profunda]|uniref:ABC transporter substrate-binding protein n=1 Tax=Lacisediminihabitans profunda TaxID=2594790 RepID=UPI00164F8D73|nr:ABC transporter substrate-binding protein [Lacisediminihabitans profunda]
MNLTLPAPASLESVVYDCVPNMEGFFKKEGLKVNVETAEGSVLALQSLETGTSDVVVVGTSPLMAGIGAGSTAKAFASVVTGSYAYPAVLPNSPIKTFLDLQGKTVGVPSLQSGSIPFTRGLVALAGGNPKLVEFLPTGFGAPALAALKSGQIDALGLWDTAYEVIKGLGQPLRFIQNDQSKKLGFQVVYAAKSAWIDKNPKVALGMSRAMNKAYVFAITNPEAALKDCWDEYPNLVPTGVDPVKAKADGLAAVKARLASSGPVDGVYGTSTADQVQTFYSLQVAAGTVKPGITVGQLWTDKFVKDANKFDVAAVKKAAAAKK